MSKNKGKFPRDRASADTFCVLGRCCPYPKTMAVVVRMG